MWITDFRQAHGLTLEELGRAIRYVGRKKDPELRVSDVLLENLETKPGYKTVPKLADLIAETCGATAAQRDELVLEQYRGTWKPKRRSPVKAALGAVARPMPPGKTAPPPTDGKAHPRKGATAERDARSHRVYGIDRQGNIVHRYTSVKNAFAMTGLLPSTIRKRCYGIVRGNEFRGMGFTFRYADLWDSLTEDQRRAEVALAAASLSERPEGNQQPVVAIDRNGSVWRFDSLRDASRMTGDSPPAISQHIHGERTRTVYSWRGFAYRRAGDWDAMTAKQRKEFLKK